MCACCVCPGKGMDVPRHTELWESVFSLYCVGPRDWTQFCWLNSTFTYCTILTNQDT